MRVQPEPGIGKFRHVGLGENHGSGLAQPLHDDGIRCGRLCGFQDGGAGCRGLAGDIEQILDGEQFAVEGAKRDASPAPRIGGVGCCARGFRVKPGEYRFPGYLYSPELLRDVRGRPSWGCNGRRSERGQAVPRPRKSRKTRLVRPPGQPASADTGRSCSCRARDRAHAARRHR